MPPNPFRVMIYTWSIWYMYMFYQLSGFREDDLTHFLIISLWQGTKESWKPVTLECPVPNVGRNGLRINVETDGRRTFGPGELKLRLNTLYQLNLSIALEVWSPEFPRIAISIEFWV